MTDGVPSPRNWWKYGFFGLLVLFEITREIAVLSATDEAKFGTTASFFHTNSYASASGMWKRTDNGGDLVPSITTIECEQALQRCTEISVHINNGYVMPPLTDHFEANFSTDGITYENDHPDCAKYSVRLDYRLRAVLAVRERVDNPSNERCQILEDRIEMRLDDAMQDQADMTNGHFVPIIALLNYLF